MVAIHTNQPMPEARAPDSSAHQTSRELPAARRSLRWFQSSVSRALAPERTGDLELAYLSSESLSDGADNYRVAEEGEIRVLPNLVANLVRCPELGVKYSKKSGRRDSNPRRPGAQTA